MTAQGAEGAGVLGSLPGLVSEGRVSQAPQDEPAETYEEPMMRHWRNTQ